MNEISAEAYFPVVKAFARRLHRTFFLCEYADLESAGMEGLVRALNNLDPSRSDLETHAYIRRKIRGYIQDEVKNEFRRRRKFPFKVSLDSDPALRNQILSSPDKSENIECKLLWRQLVDKLPEKHRIVVDMYYLQGMLIADIASEFGCTASNISIRLNKARARLRQIWERKR